MEYCLKKKVVTTTVDLPKIMNNEWELLMRALTAIRKMFGTWKSYYQCYSGYPITNVTEAGECLGMHL